MRRSRNARHAARPAESLGGIGLPGAERRAGTWPIAAAKVAVSFGLLALLVGSLDLGALRALLATLPRAALAAALVLLVAQTLVLGLRWWLVISAMGTRRPIGRVLAIGYVGVFFNQVLPSAFGGDAVRMWAVYRDGMSADAAVGSVLLERIGGVLGLVVMVTLGVWYLGPALDHDLLRPALLAVLPLFLLGMALLCVLDRMPPAWRGLPVARELVRLAGQARRVFLAPALALPLLGLSLCSHALSGAAAYALAAGLGLGLSLWDCLALFPAAILATMIPVSFAGWGLREGATVGLFAFLGVSADAALAVSLAFGLVLLVASLPGCLLWFALRSRRQAPVAPGNGPGRD